MKQLICNIEKLQTRVALVEHNRLEEYYIERNDVPRIVGSIFKGRIRNLEASLQAAFVDIGLEKNAFLHYWDMIPASIDRLEDEDETDGDEYTMESADDDDSDSDSDDSDSDSDSDSDGDSEQVTRSRRRRGRRNRNRNRDGNRSQDSNSDSDSDDDGDNDSDDDAGDDTSMDFAADDESRSSRRPAKAERDDRPQPQERLSRGERREPEGRDAKSEPIASSAPIASPPTPPRATESGIMMQAEDLKPAPRKPVSLTEKLKRLFSGSRTTPVVEPPPPAGADVVVTTPKPVEAPATTEPEKVVSRQAVRAAKPSQQQVEAADETRQDDDTSHGNSRRDDSRSPDESRGGDSNEDTRRSNRPSRRDNRSDRGSDRGGDRDNRSDRGGDGDDSRTRRRSSGGGGGGGSKSDSGGGNRRRRQSRNFDLDEIPKKFQVNSEVVVQVTKGMIGEKGPRVTTNLSMPGRYTVLLPNSDHRGVSRRIEDRKERNRLRDALKKIDMPRNMGLICRTAGIGLTEDAIRLDVELLLEKWQMAEHLTATRRAPVCVYQEPSLLERTIRDFLSEDITEIVVDTKAAFDLAQSYIRRLDESKRPKIKLHDDPTPIFQRYRLVEQIGGIFRRKVPLASGAELCIDETEALIAIDINSGRSRGGKDHPETILKTNVEAAEEVARQLRLRNIGGLVVVDFIDMRSRRDQLMVYRKMKDSLSRDRAKTKILPLSKLGLMEMTRQREHESLQDTIFDTCPYCRGRGLVKSATTVSVEIQRRLQELLRRDRGRTPIRVVVHPRVLDRLKTADANILRSMEREFGGDLSFRSDPNIHQEAFHLIDIQSGKEL